MKAVLDANSHVSAAITPGGLASAILEFAEEGRFEAVISEALLDEVRDVLMRPKFRKHIAADDVAPYLRRLRRAATLVGETGEAPRYTADRDDDYLVELALRSGADLLVSRDGDLLDPGSELPVRVVSPEDFIAKLRTMD